MTSEQPETDQIDIRNNPESRAAAANITTAVARASDGGAVPRDAPAAGELPEEEVGGTASGNPVAGLEIDPEARAEAVSGDTGPDELGNRGPGPDTSNNAGHA